MNIVLSDIRPLLLLLPVLLTLAGILIVLQRRGTHAPSRLLTRSEWILLAKLIAIPLLIIVLLLGKIAINFPAEMFLYGRF